MKDRQAIRELRCAFLVGPRLMLRLLREEDLTDEYLSWLNDQEVSHYLTGVGRFPSTKASLQAYYRHFHASVHDLLFAIIDRRTGRHIGNVALNHIDWVHRTTDTGILIGRKGYWGRGYGREAWGLVLEYAFRRLGLHKIIAGAVADHTASIRTMQRLGFRLEGVLRQEVFIDGAHRDVLRFGLLQAELTPVNGTVHTRRRRVVRPAQAEVEQSG